MILLTTLLKTGPTHWKKLINCKIYRKFGISMSSFCFCFGNSLTHFMPPGLFLYPLKTSANLSFFLSFQGVEKKGQWYETCQLSISECSSFNTGSNAKFFISCLVTLLVSYLQFHKYRWPSNELFLTELKWALNANRNSKWD